MISNHALSAALLLLLLLVGGVVLIVMLVNLLTDPADPIRAEVTGEPEPRVAGLSDAPASKVLARLYADAENPLASRGAWQHVGDACTAAVTVASERGDRYAVIPTPNGQPTPTPTPEPTPAAPSPLPADPSTLPTVRGADLYGAPGDPPYADRALLRWNTVGAYVKGYQLRWRAEDTSNYTYGAPLYQTLIATGQDYAGAHQHLITGLHQDAAYRVGWRYLTWQGTWSPWSASADDLAIDTIRARPTPAPTPGPAPDSWALWEGQPVELVSQGQLALTVPPGAGLSGHLEVKLGRDRADTRLGVIDYHPVEPHSDGVAHWRLDGVSRALIPPDLGAYHRSAVLHVEVSPMTRCDQMEPVWGARPMIEVRSLGTDRPVQDWRTPHPTPWPTATPAP